jgi:hypothetical protein
MTRPGVFFKLTDLGQSVVGQVSSVMALAGNAQWGPHDEKVLLSSYDEFVQYFGKPVNPDATPAHYQALGFFKNGGAAYFVRPVSDTTTYGYASAAGDGADISAGAAGTTSLTLPGADVFAVFTKYRGVCDSGDIYIEVTDVSGDEFTLVVGTDVSNNLINRAALDTEVHICSVLSNKRDGFGRSMYMPDVLERDSLLAAGRLSDTADAADIPSNVDTAVALSGNAYVAASAADIATAYSLYHSLSGSTIDYVVPGDFTDTVLNACVGVAATRQDCMAILSPSVADAATATSGSLDVATWLATITDQGYYAAAYFTVLSETDADNDRIVQVPCAGHVAGIYAYTDAVSYPWMAPAGPRRARVRARGLVTEFSTAEMDSLYDSKLNWIESSPRYGLIVQGQKTLYGVHSPLNRVNVARLLMKLRRDLTSFLEDFVNEINNEVTRTLISTQVDNYLLGIQSQQGLARYKIVCSDQNNTAQDLNNNRLNVDIYVQPPSVAEFIYLRTFVTSAGVDFANLQVTTG